MTLPTKPAVLTVEQIAALNNKLTVMRHDIANHVQIVSVYAEMARMKPAELNARMALLLERAMKIPEEMRKFTVEFQSALGFTETGS